jgi:hypothetical protein
LFLSVSLVALTAVITFIVTWASVPRTTKFAAKAAVGASPSVFSTPSDGTDPASAGCSTDATVLGEKPVALGSAGSGVIELKYSPRCHGGWARFYLNPNSTPVFVEVRVQSSDGRASAFAYLAEGNTPVYTDLLHPDDGCLTASVTTHPQNKEPVIVSTPCVQGK